MITSLGMEANTAMIWWTDEFENTINFLPITVASLYLERIRYAKNMRICSRLQEVEPPN